MPTRDDVIDLALTLFFVLLEALCLLGFALLIVFVSQKIAWASESCPTLREIREAYPHSHPSWHYYDGHRCWYIKGKNHHEEKKQHIDKVRIYSEDEYNELDAAAGVFQFDTWERVEPIFKH